MPERAEILARDGTPLAEGPAAARSSPLGVAATNVAGEVSTRSERQDRELVQLGFPPGEPTGTSGLMLVPSHIDLAGAEIELASMPDRESLLRKALASIPADVEIVLIDCPPSLGLLTLNALVAATSMLIPTQCEYFALEGLRHLMYTHQLVRSRLNPRLAIAGILMTQFDARTTLAWDVLETVRRTHPHHVLETLIPRNVRISEAPSHGKSVIEYDPTCRGAAAYRALAKELLER